MKKSLSLTMLSVFILGSIAYAPNAQALSCLATEDYLESVLGNETTILFIGTSLSRTDTDTYTAEVLSVSKALQGYVEKELFVYHQKHPDWNYLCNAGPQAKGTTGLYVVERDAFGQYNVSQRLALTEPIATDFLKKIDEAAIEGSIIELSNTDQQNQVFTTIRELLERMSRLFGELAYWQTR